MKGRAPGVRIVTEALVLRSVDFGESDRIVHLLTRSGGRLTAMAKGARRSTKRFPGTLDFFNHLKAHLQVRGGQAMARLEQAVLVSSFEALRVDPSRFALAVYLLELLDRLAPERLPRADAERLFAFAGGALQAIARGRPGRRLQILLELRTLAAVGLRPELRSCVRCGRPVEGGTVAFHVPEGGCLCAACGLRAEGALTLHLGTLRALDQALQLGLDRLERLALGEVAEREGALLVRRFQRFHTGLELRSEPVVDRLLAARPPG
ncbi:MAG: DNA repair protein RecO [Proteobacteria bacterium]|nr:DNA repair protein RecO [Pseudomonadota bacterium]